MKHTFSTPFTLRNAPLIIFASYLYKLFNARIIRFEISLKTWTKYLEQSKILNKIGQEQKTLMTAFA